MDIPIEGWRVIVKFYCTNPNLTPTGIKFVPRNEGLIEAKHWQEGKKLGLPQGGLGSTRPNRVDTGKHQEFRNVNLVPIWNQLKHKYEIGDVHMFIQQISKGMKKRVLVITFQHEKPQRKVNNRLLAEIEKNFVQESTWGIIHHWTNYKPDGRIIITINCLQRHPNPNLQPKSP